MDLSNQISSEYVKLEIESPQSHARLWCMLGICIGVVLSGVALLVLNFQKKKREKEMAAMVDFHRKSFTESGGTDPKMNEKIKSQRRSREAV